MRKFKKMFDSFLLWGLRPGSTAQETRVHRYISHGLLYSITLIIFAFPTIEFFIRLGNAYEGVSGKYDHNRGALFLHCLIYLVLNLCILYLRRFHQWRSFWVAVGGMLMIAFQSTFMLMLGIDTGLMYMQLSLAPIAFLGLYARPIAASLIAAFDLLLAGLVFLYLSNHPPTNPAPPVILPFLRPALIGVGALLLLMQIFYLAALTDFFERLKATWLRFSRIGADKFTNSEQIRNNTISNQVLMIFILLMVFVTGIQLVVSSLLIFENPGSYMVYPVLYFLPSIAYAGLLAWIFRAKNVIGHVTAFEGLAYLSGLCYVFYYSLLQNLAVGFHFILLTLAVVPVFFSQAGWLFRIFCMVAAPVIFLLRIQMSEKGWFPLPAYMTGFITSTIFYTNATVFSTSALYLWIKAKLTGKFINMWRTWSNFGVDLFNSEIDKKYRRIQNQSLLIFLGVLSFLLGTLMILAVETATVNRQLGIRFGLHYGLPTLWQLLVTIGALLTARKVANILPVSVGFASGIFFVGFLGISLQPDTMLYLYNWVLLPLPFMALSRRPLINRILAATATAIIIGMTLFSLWFFKHRAPLFPLPLDWMVPFSYYTSVSSMLFVFSMYFQYIWYQNTATDDKLEMERSKSDALLLNILPAHVAAELRESGHARPILFSSASVMFTDFVGFTKIAETMQPEELVGELDRCFSYFDSVCVKYKLEKLKTIGDSFMCAGGIPIPNNTHAIDVCLAAIEIQSFMDQMKEIKSQQGEPYWELRLGINTGNLVAGVVGERKFAYDVWGDTVNIASRMESSGIIGGVNLSRATYECVKYIFRCNHRGKVNAKNKGAVDMFVLEGIKPKYSVGAEGRVPNELFKGIYAKLERGGRFQSLKA